MSHSAAGKLFSITYLFLSLTFLPAAGKQALPDDLEKTVETAYGLIVYDLSFSEEFFEKVDREKLAKATSLNDARAQLVTARLYERGVHVAQDYAKAFQYYQKASEQSQHLATVRLGVFYFRGFEVERDEKRGVEILKEVASKDFPWAWVKMCEIYRKGGKEVGTDRKKAAIYGDFALSSEDPRCVGRIKAFRGYDRVYGRSGQKQDYPKGARILEEAAALGDEEALRFLAGLNFYGQGRPRNYDKSFELYKRSAEKGDSYSMKMLGKHFLYSIGRPKDVEKALFWYTKAARFGDGEASALIGEMYLEGVMKSIGPEKALAWIRKSADLKAKHGIFLLAKVYENGLCGVEKDVEKALSMYTEIAYSNYRKGGWSSWLPAVKRLSWLYQGNNGVALDGEKAIEWLSFRADEEDYFQIGQLYDYGKGVKQNHELAFENYLRAAEKGNRHAAHKVAQFYEKGIGVEKDLEKAAHWKSK